ncbi:MAG: imidazole glycerol phosphate synthase subunit HisH [Clostridia bacterium]|nr:imidazole glycerol phosphate synthase subunit HisH [Clostridia bacterium]
MIAIVDYGMGNLRSVQKALQYIGEEAEITSSPARLDSASHVILPGVGAFADAIACLRKTGLDQALLRQAASGKPLLGICLGMQLFYEASEENGEHEGLGLLPGRITRLKAPGLKVPHMGWNTLTVRESPLFREGESPCVYFVHSYCAAGESEFTAASCEYGEVFTASAWRGNVLATQYHPEKSGSVGLTMLRRFAEMR